MNSSPSCPEGITVFAVVWTFSDPAEVESLWLSRESAEKRLAEVPRGGGWVIETMVARP